MNPVIFHAAPEESVYSYAKSKDLFNNVHTVYLYSIQPIIINCSNVPFSVKFSRQYHQDLLNQLVKNATTICLRSILFCLLLCGAGRGDWRGGQLSGRVHS
jgi:hypothetical protein